MSADAVVLKAGCRVLIRQSDSDPAGPRRGWLLRELPEARWLVHMEDVHPEQVAAADLVPDLAPPSQLHPVDHFLDRVLPTVLDVEKDTPTTELPVRVVEVHTMPLRRVFLLDTSVIRSVPTRDLVELTARGIVLGYSSYSAWEMLANLEANYRLVRGWLLKLRHLRHLDDPHRMFLLGARVLEPKEIEDADTLGRLLPLVERSPTWEDFARNCEATGEGALALIGEGVREIFDNGEEEAHVEYLQTLVKFLRDKGWNLNDDQVALEAISRNVDRVIEDAVERGANSTGLSDRMWPIAYVRAAYLVERGAYYARSGANPDRNDYVDSSLCWHLHIHFPRTLVTLDRGFHDAVKASLDRLARNGVGFLTRVAGWPIPPDVIEEELQRKGEFEAMLGP